MAAQKGGPVRKEANADKNYRQMFGKIRFCLAMVACKLVSCIVLMENRRKYDLHYE